MTAPTHSDVLIIGAGSAGSVLAERLSEDRACTVTVVEAGPGPADDGVRAMTDDGLRLPIGSASPLVARYDTTLTDGSRHVARLVRGATVGGSGAVNGGYFCRAVRSDFAEWDLPGWSWDDVLPHYRAIETDLDFGDADPHGGAGPIRVGRTRNLQGSSALFADDAARAGYPWVADLNATPGLPTGVGAVPLNIVDGVRLGPGAAFLVPALGRPNLTALTGRRAVRVVIVRGRAIGVDVVGSGGVQRLTAERIVLCCGAIGTAHLLMLSGVGPESMLAAAGVRTVLPAAVGARTIDHPEWVLPTTWTVAPGRPVLEVVLSTADGIEVRPYTGGFITMIGDAATGRPDWPHVGVALMKPRSRGRITLASAQATVPPRIEHRYDTVADDVAALAAGAQLVREIVYGTTELGEPSWSTSQHLCGSAPMGSPGDDGAVLDERCRVRGLDGLWVIDGAALPSIPSRGPHATTVMLAHRAAEFVLSSST